MTRDEVKRYIEENLKNNFIGAHGSRVQDKYELTRLMKDGLDLRTQGNAYGMAGTVKSFGNSNESKNVEEATYYAYARNGLIISVPVFLKYGDKTTFLGYPAKTERGLPKDQSDYKCLMTKVFDELGKIPSCFILAYYTTDQEGNREFTLNPNHYLALDKEKRDKAFSDVLEEVKRKSEFIAKQLIDYTTPYNIENLKGRKQVYQQRTNLLGFEPLRDRTMDLFFKTDEFRLAEADLQNKTGQKHSISEFHALAITGRSMETEKVMRETTQGIKTEGIFAKSEENEFGG